MSAGAEVGDDEAETCSESFRLAGADSAAVVTAGVTILDEALEDVVTDVETTSTGRGDDETSEGVLVAGVVSTEFGFVVFTFVETAGFGSTGALDGEETAAVGFTLGGDATVLEGGDEVVVQSAITGVAVTEITETEGAWDWTVAATPDDAVTTWGTVGSWSEAEAVVGGS